MGINCFLTFLRAFFFPLGDTMRVKRPIDKIIIHCSATPPDMDIGAAEIDRWHKERGFKEIGYHWVIRRDGTIEDGRDPEKVGAHVQGHNTGSFGICLVGGIDKAGKPAKNFTEAQWRTLERFIRALRADYPKATIHGHNEFAQKACPSFDVQDWLTGLNL